MIELGDVLKTRRGNESMYVVTEKRGLAEVRLVEYEGAGGKYRGNEVWEQAELRSQIRNGNYDNVGNVTELPEAVIDISEGKFKVDLEATQDAYADAESDESGGSLDSDTLFFDTHNKRLIRVEELGWESESLADDLVRFDVGVESYSTVVQAMQEGIWLLVRRMDRVIEGNSNVNVALEVDSETGKIKR